MEINNQKNMIKKTTYLLFLLLVNCSEKNNDCLETAMLDFKNVLEIPRETKFDTTLVGGLSGITYNPQKDVFYIISDDRKNKIRFYEASFFIGEKGIDSIQFLNVHEIKNQINESYKSWDEFPSESADPEDIRFNPSTNLLTWTDEGEKLATENDSLIIVDPSINIMTLNGSYLNSINPPTKIKYYDSEKGLKRNKSLESLSFSPDYKHLYTISEEAIIEDKPSSARLFKIDLKSNEWTESYLYKISESKKNYDGPGISAILFINENQFLSVERSYNALLSQNEIELFLCDLSKASNIIRYDMLDDESSIKCISKTKLVSLSDCPVEIENVEGLTFGKDLENGHKSLILVTDDNFSSTQKSQFIFFDFDDSLIKN